MRTIFLCLLTGLVGLSIGLMVNVQVLGGLFAPEPPAETVSASVRTNLTQAAPSSDTTAVSPATGSNVPSEALLDQAYAALNALQSADYAALSALVHPDKGLTLTPYSTVTPGKDRTVSKATLSNAAKDKTIYTWGTQDGSGASIQMNIVSYFSRYVYNADYGSAPMIGINTVLSSGNALENVKAAYPDADFVEFYYPELQAKNGGFDWCGLKLVFEKQADKYLLIALIHSEWTV